MPNTPISRDTVHSLAEACSDQGELFQPVAARLIKHQRRLSRFFEQNVAEMGPMASQVGLYMLSVSLRVFDQVGGRMGKVNGEAIAAATNSFANAGSDPATCKSSMQFALAASEGIFLHLSSAKAKLIVGISEEVALFNSPESALNP